MNFVKYIGRQFAKPEGIGGKLSTYLMNRMNQRQYESVEKCFPQTAGKNILDIGFGNGYLLHRFAVKYNAAFYGVEVSKDMLISAEKRNKQFIESGKMSLRIGDVAKLPYSDDFFDFCYTVNTVYFWENPVNGFFEINRTLSREGTFVNAFYTKNWLNKLQYTKYDFIKYEPDELVKIAIQAGFQNVRLHEIERDCAYLQLMEK